MSRNRKEKSIEKLFNLSMEKSPKKEKVEKMRKFKPDMRSAIAILTAIAYLQITGFTATLKNIKSYISQRCRKPASTILNNLPTYLSRGTKLGIFKKRAGVYKLLLKPGDFELKMKKKKSVKASEHKSERREDRTNPPQLITRYSCFDICWE